MAPKNWYNVYMNEAGDGGEGGGGGGGTGTAPAATPPAGETPPAAGGATTPPAAGGTPPATKPEGDWPADWRQKLSPDGKHSKRLDRFASPNAVLDSYIALQQKVDSGELRANQPYPDKGTPEDQAKWRKAHEVPDTPEGYTTALPEGLVIGELDKPAIDDFTKYAHAKNLPASVVKDNIKWYYEWQGKQIAAQAEKDADYHRQSEDALRAEWGGEYRTNINVLKGLVDSLPESIRDSFVQARLGDGTALLNNPDMARWLVATARTLNPMATVVPGAGANSAAAVEDEIAAIEKTMLTNRSAYNADLKMQERLRALYDARERGK